MRNYIHSKMGIIKFYHDYVFWLICTQLMIVQLLMLTWFCFWTISLTSLLQICLKTIEKILISILFMILLLSKNILILNYPFLTIWSETDKRIIQTKLPHRRIPYYHASKSLENTSLSSIFLHNPFLKKSIKSGF